MDERANPSPIHTRHDPPSLHPLGPLITLQPPSTMDQLPILLEPHRRGCHRNGCGPHRIGKRRLPHDGMPHRRRQDRPRPHRAALRMFLPSGMGHRHRRRREHTRRRPEGESTVQGIRSAKRSAEGGPCGRRRLRTEHGSRRGGPSQDSQHETERVHSPLVRGVQIQAVGQVRDPHAFDARHDGDAVGPHRKVRSAPRDSSGNAQGGGKSLV
mmetsp:Transcript_21185/g.44160  ORF Transcript_21185/g.44160 Transcript_21185/m.44160 type:complete len:212 (-) Transcript_21185:2323-2958(-)